jgi:hypothetical protein
MNDRWRNSSDLSKEGMEALIERLGVSDAIRFVQQTSPGSGDYTAEREEYVQPVTVDELINQIQAEKKRAAG